MEGLKRPLPPVPSKKKPINHHLILKHVEEENHFYRYIPTHRTYYTYLWHEGVTRG